MIVFKILQQVLVNHFYKVNTGFFLFGFFVLFGLPYQPLSFHLSLISGIVQSQVFLWVVMVGWLFYCAKCIDYITRQIAGPRQNFLFCLNNLSVKTTYLYLLLVQFFVYLPVFIYAIIIVVKATTVHAWAIGAEVILFTTAALMAPAYLYLLAVQKRKLYKSFSLPQVFTFHFTKPLFSFPLFYLWYERKQMLLVTKVFTFGLLYLFIHLYQPDHADVRPLLLCLLLVGGAHSSIVFQVRAFEEEYLGFSRNLPITTLARFAGMLLMYAILILPESLYVCTGYGIHFALHDYPQIVLLFVSLPVIFHITLLLEATNTDQFIRIVFGILAALFFVLLYNPGIVLPLALLALSFALFAAYYYTFEQKP